MDREHEEKEEVTVHYEVTKEQLGKGDSVSLV
jgi:hypothetical protein